MSIKVLIAGSTNYEGSDDSKELFISACKELGAALTKAGFEIVVRSSNLKTADRYVVEGASEVDGRHKVLVLTSDERETPFKEDIPKLEERINFRYRRIRGPWAAKRVSQVLSADAVIIMGGGKGTATVGYIAPALKRPILAIASFGGSASELWAELEPYYDRLGQLKDELPNLHEHWQSSHADLAVQAVREMINRRLFKSDSRAPSVFLLLIQLTLFAAWVWLFANPIGSKVITFFLLLAVAAFLGTGLRNSLRLVFEPTAEFSWDRILNELTAGILLTYGLALIYLTGGLVITGNLRFVESLSEESGDYQRVAVTMSILGFAGGFLIERAADSLKSWLAGHLASGKQ